MTLSNCPICGYDLGGAVEEDELRLSYWICDCCGCEYGLDDTPEYREKWISDGAKWFTESSRPGDWDLQAQLKYCNLKWNKK